MTKAIAIDHVVLHAEVLASVPDQLVQFFKRSFIEQEIDPLAHRELAFRVLPLSAVLRRHPLPRVRAAGALLPANVYSYPQHVK